MESKNRGIDLRDFKCSCNKPNCIESGISFDGNILRFHFLKEESYLVGEDTYTQEEKHMYLNKETAQDLIETLQEIIESEFEGKKSAKEWFYQLYEPYRNKAINNSSENMLKTKRESLKDAIKNSFKWTDTREGWDYWESIYKSSDLISNNKKQ